MGKKNWQELMIYADKVIFQKKLFLIWVIFMNASKHKWRALSMP